MRVNNAKSVLVAGTHSAIPGPRRAAVKFWGFVAGLIILAGIVYALFGGWYWAPIGIAVGFAVEGANRRSAQQFIVDTAANDADFRTEMKMAGVILED